jgi:hypothetical protein
MAYVYQQVRDTAAAWTAANPVLPEGILAFEKDTLKWKLGDGVTAWNSLSYHYDSASLQEKLVSGTNIKTINNESLLGSGNLTITGGSSGGFVLDGGAPDTDYTGQPAIDCGGVT